MPTNNFINEIKFEDNFPPFKWWNKIYFWGKNEVQNLIKFYLKNKSEDSYEWTSEENARRFKINCILGNNWGGKSNLLSELNKIWQDNYKTKENTKNDNKKIEIDTKKDKISILDNMSIFDYTKINIENKKTKKRKNKNKINDWTKLLLEFTKWTHDLWILWRFLIPIVYYSYILQTHNIKNDPLKEFLWFSLLNKEKKFNFKYWDNKYDLYSLLEKFNKKEEKENKTLFEFINDQIEYNSQSNKKFDFSDIDYLIKLSSWQKIILLRFAIVLINVFEEYERFKDKLKKEWRTDKEIKEEFFETVILIDEPDLHLHLDWQKQYIKKLIDVFSTLDTNIKLHFIIATHSPFIISDLPSESIVILDWKDSDTNKTEFTQIRTYNWTDINDNNKNKDLKQIFEEEKKNGKVKKSFWANFVDIINDWFFFKDKVLMGSFAENIIWSIAKLERDKIVIKSNLFDVKLKLENKEYKNKNWKIKLEEKKDFLEKQLKGVNVKISEEKELWIKKGIWDEFLKNNLLYFIKGN